MSSDIFLELDMCLINTVEPEEEYELFSKIDEALFNDDYAKASGLSRIMILIREKAFQVSLTMV